MGRLDSLAAVGLSALIIVGVLATTATAMQETFQIDQKRIFSSQIDVVVSRHG